MTTLNDLIGRLRAMALDRPPYDTLATTTVNNTDTTTAMAVQDGSLFQALNIIDFDDATFEAALVSAKPTQITATIVRGWQSTKGSHVAGAVIRVNPRYTAFQYRQALNSALAAIGTAFGRNVWDTSQSFSTTTRIISVPAAAKRVLEVAEKPSASFTELNPVRFDFLGSAPSVLAATGKAVRLIGNNPGTGTAYVHYQDAWPLLVNGTDTLDADYPPDAEDLITIGAQAYLLDSDAFALVAFQEPHVKVRQFGSHLGDVRGEFATAMQHFVTRRSEVAATRPSRSPAWMRGY